MKSTHLIIDNNHNKIIISYNNVINERHGFVCESKISTTTTITKE